MAALQSLVILAALPFSVVMIGMCVSLVTSLRREKRAIDRAEHHARSRRIVEHLSDQVSNRVMSEVQDTIEESITSATEEIASTLSEAPASPSSLALKNVNQSGEAASSASGGNGL